MRWRCAFLLALFLPELALDPFNADLPMGWPHLLGTDSLGRDGLLRLLHGGARSFGLASAVALASLVLGLFLALGEDRFRDGRSALRSLPSLLLLIPLRRPSGDLVGHRSPCSWRPCSRSNSNQSCARGWIPSGGDPPGP